MGGGGAGSVRRQGGNILSDRVKVERRHCRLGPEPRRERPVLGKRGKSGFLSLSLFLFWCCLFHQHAIGTGAHVIREQFHPLIAPGPHTLTCLGWTANSSLPLTNTQHNPHPPPFLSGEFIVRLATRSVPTEPAAAHSLHLINQPKRNKKKTKKPTTPFWKTEPSIIGPIQFPSFPGGAWPLIRGAECRY